MPNREIDVADIAAATQVVREAAEAFRRFGEAAVEAAIAAGLLVRPLLELDPRVQLAEAVRKRRRARYAH